MRLTQCFNFEHVSKMSIKPTAERKKIEIEFTTDDVPRNILLACTSTSNDHEDENAKMLDNVLPPNGPILISQYNLN